MDTSSGVTIKKLILNGANQIVSVYHMRSKTPTVYDYEKLSATEYDRVNASSERYRRLIAEKEERIRREAAEKEARNPNNEAIALGVDEEDVGVFCTTVSQDELRIYQGYQAPLYFILLLESEAKGDDNIINLTYEDAKPILREAWDSKYSKCFCGVQYGRAASKPLDLVSILMLSDLKSANWVELLYDPAEIGANVNRIFNLNGFSATVLDRLDGFLRGDGDRLPDYQKTRLLRRIEMLEKFGGKRFFEMSEEERLQNGADPE